MNAVPPSPAAPRPPRRRWRRRLLIALAIVLLATAGSVHWLLRPERLAPAILAFAGDALGLEITASGLGEYRLRGTPQLIVRGVVAREKGAATPVLTADRIFISVPWSTLRARGRDLTATRLELDAPVFDLAAFQRWQSHRPPGETRIPTLTGGLRVLQGRVLGEGWAVDGIELHVPRLADQQALRGVLRGRYHGEGLQAPLDLAFNLRRLGADGGLGIAGNVDPTGDGWRLPMHLRLSAYLRLSRQRLDHAVLGAHGRYLSGEAAQRFALGVAGPLDFADGLRWQPAALSLQGLDAVPSLKAAGRIALVDGLQFDWRGQLAGWPADWPALPPPLARSPSPLPFALAYQGTPDLADIAHLRLQRDQTRFDARFRLFEVMAWLEALETGKPGSPLPPLSGRLLSPRLEVSGATLEGVEVRIDDPALPAIGTTP